MDEMDKEQLQRRILSLEQKLDESEEQVMQAATVGKDLLEENCSLKHQAEKMVDDYSKQIEGLQQDIYELQHKLTAKSSQESWFNEEISMLKHEIQSHKSVLQDNQDDNAKKVSTLNRKIRDVQSELDKAHSMEQQHKSQISQLEALLQEKQEMNETLSNSFVTEEMGNLHNTLVELEKENSKLKGQLIELKAECEKSKMEVESLRPKLLMKDQEIEEIQCQATSYACSVERHRTEIMELNAQLEALRMETQDHRNKGNSLFSEVEDRRVLAEKKLITLKVQHDAVKSRYDLVNQQLHKMKMQMVTLLQMSGGQVDSERITKLQEDLALEREEKKRLLQELNQLEKKNADHHSDLADLYQKIQSDIKHSSDQDYVNYLLTMIKSKSEEVTQLNSKCKTQNMILLDRKDKISSLERQLYDFEMETEKFRSLYLKQKLTNEELVLKYEPENVKSQKKVLQFKKEKIDVPTVSEENPENSIIVKDINRSILQQRPCEKKQNKVTMKGPHWETEKDSSACTKEVEKKSKGWSKGKSVSLSEEVTVMNDNGDIDVEHLLESDTDLNLENLKAKSEHSKKSPGRRVKNVVPAPPPLRDGGDIECKTQ